MKQCSIIKVATWNYPYFYPQRKLKKLVNFASMNRQKSLTRIAELLARFTNEISLLNTANLYDINIHAENILIPLINIAFGLEVVNANFVKEKNFAAVDLIDNKNRVAFQVTSTADNEKIKHTLNQFIKHEHFLNYDLLFIYIISGKQPSYTGKGHQEILQGKFAFDKDNNIIDSTDLYKKISGIITLEPIQKIEAFLEQELTDKKIQLRKKTLENPSLKQNLEHIYYNVLEAKLPVQLFIADIIIDRDKIIKDSWTTQYKLKMDASPRKVMKRAIIEAGLGHISDWHCIGKQLITFRNLQDRGEGLTGFIDKGTVTTIKPNDFWAANEDQQRSFIALLNFSLQEKLYSKAIQWVAEDEVYRFIQDRKIINQRLVTWKKTNRATRTVIFEIFDKEKQVIKCFRHLAFYAQFSCLDNKWLLSINPTWSYTTDGFTKSGLSKFYAAKLKRLENNNTIYYAFRFLAYCLNNSINNENPYPYLDFVNASFEEVITEAKFDSDDVVINEEIPADQLQ